jgi:guanine deaminase
MKYSIFMKKAIKEASIGLCKGHGGPFGAVVVQNGKVIAKAHNKVLKLNDATAHAEIQAIRKASKKLGTFDLSGCEIYTTCMPCPMCMGAIRWANIKSVYFGATSQDAEDIGFRDKEFYEKDFLELKNIQREECLELFKTWQDKEDKIVY